NSCLVAKPMLRKRGPRIFAEYTNLKKSLCPRSIFLIRVPPRRSATKIMLLLAAVILVAASCTSIMQRADVRPLVLRDVPAQRLAFRFEPDVAVPAEIRNEDADDKIEAIQLDFNTR